MDALAQIDGWPAEHAAAGVVAREGVVATRGPRDRVFHFASVTKPVTALAVLVAAEEGTIDLDEPAGPPARARPGGAGEAGDFPDRLLGRSWSFRAQPNRCAPVPSAPLR